jgi:hypothetical protein
MRVGEVRLRLVKLGYVRLVYVALIARRESSEVLGCDPGCTPEGVTLGVRCGGPRGEADAENPPLGENSDVDGPEKGKIMLNTHAPFTCSL